MSEAERAGASRQDKSERLLAGRYRLGDVLGRGGMGTVWRAEDETLGRTVAVKELRFPTSIDEDEKRRLITRTLREAKAIARIRNNSAVTVFDVVDEDNRPWIVMELVEGKSLAEVIREDGVLTPKRAAEVGLAILDVLRSAHREGILHRDVKPSNVLIAEDGRVVLTDFGIAQVEGDPSITSTGMLVGAPSYISPERARGHKPGPAADLWSLGGLLYAAVEGVPPYDKGSAIATLTAVMTEPVEQPKNAGPLENVIYGLLAKDPDQRLDVAGARAMLTKVLHAPEAKAVVPEQTDATKVVEMPPLPDEGPDSGSSGSSGSGGAGAKRAEEPGERLRGAMRSVRKAASVAGAATAAAGAAATARAKSGAGTGAGTGAGSGAGAEGTAGGTGSGTDAGPGTGAGSGTGSGARVAPAAATPASSSVSSSASPAGAGKGAAAVVTSVSPSVSGDTSGGSAGAAGKASGWPVAPERPERPTRQVPRAPLTDVVPRRTLVIIAVVLALAVIATVLALTLGGDDSSDGAKSGDDKSSSGGATAGSGDEKSSDTSTDSGKGKNDSATGSSGEASSESTPTSSAEAGASSGSDSDDEDSDSGSGGGTTYNGAQGFSIVLPDGWKYASTDAAGVRATGPNGQKLLIAWTTTPKDDPVADWENQERSMTRSQYQRVRIASVDYRGWNTADWEFTYEDGGTKYRSIDRGFVVNPQQGYALMYTAKAADWDTDLRKDTWKRLTETFQPKS
ncbi:protein kinase [Streptomyces sp. NPDC057757]|uniref:serine/threonine-protein kinase n=1 Tax=Streptomyces sp. NPDC057757 TaxID=3346241 RepID=UPI0036779B0F